MIHGHNFLFVDQPQLQQEYDSFGFHLWKNDGGNKIEVREIGTYEGFQKRSVLVYLSGRGCYYLSNTAPDMIKKEDDWGLEVMDVLTLVWDSGNSRVLYSRGKYFAPRLLQFWIFHTFFPMVLEFQRSFRMLHVGAVEVAGGPILFSAASFGGKSTLTDYFIRQGHALYADDTLPLREEDGHYVVYPSFPYHRPYRQPETLGNRVENFARKPAPIKAIFELKRAMPDAEIEITPALGAEKFKILYHTHFIRFRFMKHERFLQVLKMAKSVPVYNVTVPWDKNRLPEVYRSIVAHTQQM
jgi:hypothetical protein